MRYLLALFLSIVSYSLCAQNVKTYIPPQAFPLIPIYKAEVERIMPTIPNKAYPLALSEHESCLTLKHSRCLNSKSQLKTSREEGAGLGQITRTYRKDGSLRFDALEETRNRHMDYLKELSWSNVYNRPDLQIRMIVLMVKDIYNFFSKVLDPIERLKFTDAAYNGGSGGTNKERIACSLSKGCNPQIWDDNVERFCLKSKEPLYGTRSACDINRHHVRDVFDNRLPKYTPYFQ